MEFWITPFDYAAIEGIDRSAVSHLKKNEIIALSWCVLDYDDDDKVRKDFISLAHDLDMIHDGDFMNAFRLMPLTDDLRPDLLANWSFVELDRDRRVFAFKDESLGSVEKWTWDFGDGTTSEEQNPIHQIPRQTIGLLFSRSKIKTVNPYDLRFGMWCKLSTLKSNLIFVILIPLLFLSCSEKSGSNLESPYGLSVSEGFQNPLGFHDSMPSFSWKLPKTSAVKKQSAYNIVVASAPDLLPDAPDVWSSGKVMSNQSVFVKYAGNPLQSRQKIYWQVRYWDSEHRVSDWSEMATVEMGLLSNADWKAKWIKIPDPKNGIPQDIVHVCLDLNI